MRAIVARTALLVGLLLLVTACSGNDDDESTPTPPPSPTAAPATPSATPAPAETPTPPPAETPTPVPTATPAPGNGTFDYTVQPGDTLFSIAQRYGTTVAALQQLNNIDDPRELRAGSVIRVPGSATASPTPSPGGPSQRIDHGPRTGNKVALTFDMGGRVEPAVDIMNWLIANNVRATIFMTGAIVDNASHDDGRRVLQLVDSRPDLFELGNHSYSHPDFTTLTDAEIRDELRRTEESVAKRTSMPMRPLFRPPFGAVDSRVLRVVGEGGYGSTIMWDIDSGDWRPIADGGPTAEQMANKVVSNAAGGSIVVMHLGGYETLEALPAMVEGLKDRGLQTSKVSELLP